MAANTVAPAAKNAPDVKPVDAVGVGIGCLFNGFFTAMALLDLSANTWAHSHNTPAHATFLRQYYAFKHEQPVIGKAMLSLMVLLPFALYGMVMEDVVGLWKRPHYRKRHAIGTLTLAGIFGVVTFVVGYLKPAEEAFVHGQGDAALLWKYHLGHVLFNLAMMTTPFFKYAAAKQADAKLAKQA